MVDRETMAGRALPDLRLKWQARTAPVRAVARFAQRNPLGAMGGLIVLALLVMALLAPVLAPYEPRQIIREAHNRVPVYVPPGSAYLLGTDHVGRDILSRIIHGARISLYVGVGAVLIGVMAGSSLVWPRHMLGSSRPRGAADCGRDDGCPWLDYCPGHYGRPGIVVEQRHYCHRHRHARPRIRTVRSQVLSVKEMEYIVAARAIGASATHHWATYCAQLSGYLPDPGDLLCGFCHHPRGISELSRGGCAPGCPQLGRHVDGRRAGTCHPGAVGRYLPGLAIFLAVLGFNLLGDALRDVLEPRLQARATARLLSR